MASEQFVNKCINTAFGFSIFVGILATLGGFLGTRPNVILTIAGIAIILSGLGVKFLKSRICALFLASAYFGIIVYVQMSNKGNDLAGPIVVLRILMGIPFILGVIGTLSHHASTTPVTTDKLAGQ